MTSICQGARFVVTAQWQTWALLIGAHANGEMHFQNNLMPRGPAAAAAVVQIKTFIHFTTWPALISPGLAQISLLDLVAGTLGSFLPAHRRKNIDRSKVRVATLKGPNNPVCLVSKPSY